MYVFQIEFTPKPRFAPIVRRFVGDYYGEVFTDEDTVASLELATHELMENAIKYTSDGLARLTVRFDAESGTLSVAIANRARRCDCDTLTALFQSIEAESDPMKLYLALMLQTAKREEGSGLGLARIRAEAKMQLHHSIVEDRVEIVATTAVGGMA